MEQVFLFGTVDPEYRGLGIGRVLFAWQLDRAQAVLADYFLPCFIRTSSWDCLTDAQHLYEHFGLRPVRWFDELLRPLDPPLEVPEVAGLAVSLWNPDRTEQVPPLHNRAFADHSGSWTRPVGKDAWPPMGRGSTSA